MEILKKIKLFIIKNTIIKKNKALILSYFANGLKKGNNLLQLVEKYKETLDKNDYNEKYIIDLLNNIKKIIITQGTSTTYILYQVGLLNEKEYLILVNYNELYLGLKVILKLNKEQNNFKQALLLLFFPTFIVLIGLLIFQPELKAFAYNALEPINSQSSTMIKIPHYLENRTFYYYTLSLYTLVYLILIYTIDLVKNKKPTLYFKLFRLAEKEFIVNTFSAIIHLRKSGQSFINSYKILSETNNEIFVKNFFNEIYIENKNGNSKGIYNVCKKYNMNKFNLAYFKIGTLTNDLDDTIDTIFEYNQEIYQKEIKRLTRYLPLVGEIIMSIFLIKPLIDIIMVTTVGAMNFTL